MRWLCTIGLYLLCSLPVTAEEEWRQVGDWVELCQTPLRNKVVTVYYDRGNELFDRGINNPEQIFVLLVTYPKVISSAMEKNSRGEWVRKASSHQDYFYLCVLLAGSGQTMIQSVEAYKVPDGSHRSYDGRDLLAPLTKVQLFNQRLNDPSEMSPVWSCLKAKFLKRQMQKDPE